MLTVPLDLDEGALACVLERAWGIGVAAMTYRPVGWSSHHWEVDDRSGNRWFVTVDELETKRFSASESLDCGFTRLRASLLSAVELAGAGREFVVAPVPGLGSDGDPVARFGSRFAVAVYPFVDGRSFAWEDGDTAEWRLAMVAMVTRVHTVPARARRHALADGRPWRRIQPARIRGRDRRHSPTRTPWPLPALLGHQGHRLRRESIPAAAYRESGGRQVVAAAVRAGSARQRIVCNALSVRLVRPKRKSVL